jgi:hypothetical protein
MLTASGPDSSFVASASFGPPSTTADRGVCESFGRTPSDERNEEVSAGTIAVDVETGVRTETLELRFEDDHYPLAYGTSTRERFDLPGGTIRVRAAGAAVPPFQAVVPAAKGVTFETLPDAIAPDGKDLVLRWGPTTDDDILMRLAFGEDGVICTFRAPAREGVIPGALVKKSIDAYLAAGAPCTGNCSFLFLATLRSTTVAAGSYDVRVAHGITTLAQVSVAR